jgi:hypothetical protein
MALLTRRFPYFRRPWIANGSCPSESRRSSMKSRPKSSVSTSMVAVCARGAAEGRMTRREGIPGIEPVGALAAGSARCLTFVGACAVTAGSPMARLHRSALLLLLASALVHRS